MEKKPSPSASPALSVREFFKRFPDDETCLTHIFNVRFGERHVCRACKVESTFHRMTNRRAWACAHCGDHLYPTAETVFEDTRTPLQLWFYAIYLFCTTRHGVSGKELQRQLGVTYKTAWRMAKHIRVLMEAADLSDQFLSGHVEIDEAYVGGHRPGKRGRGAAGKTIVMGFKERGGRMEAVVIPDVKLPTLKAETLKRVAPGSFVSTDELMSYGLLVKEGFSHIAIKHSAKEWSYFDPRTGEFFSTNSVENFWRHFKNAIRSTHIHVSAKHMHTYLAEFTFRANHRDEGNAMLDSILKAM